MGKKQRERPAWVSGEPASCTEVQARSALPCRTLVDEREGKREEEDAGRDFEGNHGSGVRCGGDDIRK